MKNFLIRILLAAAFILAAFVLASSAEAQQADEEPTTAPPRLQQPTAAPKSPPLTRGPRVGFYRQRRSNPGGPRLHRARDGGTGSFSVEGSSN